MRNPRPRFFYGWLVVIASILAGAVQSGGSVWGASVFASHMTDELGWARSAFFGAFTLRAIVGGVLSPFIGPMQDTRSGPRILMLLTGLTMGFSLITLKWVDNIVLFYVLFGALGALTMVGGAEMLTVAIVPKWFVRMRGRAVAIASTGTAMGPLFFPFLVHGIITLVGWRDAWVVLGIGSMAIMVPLALMVRSRPEDIGLLPDGAREPEPATLRQAQGERAGAAQGERRIASRAEQSFTRRQAMRTYAFWLLILAFFLSMLGMGGFHANWIPYFEDIGFSPAVGAWAATAYGVCSISVRLVWGVVAERYPVRYLLVIQALLTAVSIMLFLNITNVPTLIIAGASHGLALGGFFIMRPLIIANYFGRQNLGAINGVLRPFVTLSGAVSPLLIAGMFDIFGTYREAFLLATFTWVLAAGVVFLAAPPRRQRTASEAVAG
ncbi:MAG: MFS transporter [Chloroflexi bacterium]|nr:MFS transporter [Chloroflexota bacterium]